MTQPPLPASDVSTSSARAPAFSIRKWWPLFLWLVGIALVLLAFRQGWDFLLVKIHYEMLGLSLVSLAAGVFLGRARVANDPLRLILGCFAFALTARELHFPGTGIGVYLAMLACAVWAWRWRARLAPLWVRKPVSTWFLSSLATYAFSQIIAQRFMRFLPYEGEPHDLHIYYEELTEVVAHLLLLITAIL